MLLSYRSFSHRKRGYGCGGEEWLLIVLQMLRSRTVQNFIIFLCNVAELSEFLSSQDFYIALRETSTALGMFSLLIFG